MSRPSNIHPSQAARPDFHCCEERSRKAPDLGDRRDATMLTHEGRLNSSGKKTGGCLGTLFEDRSLLTASQFTMFEALSRPGSGHSVISGRRVFCCASHQRSGIRPRPDRPAPSSHVIRSIALCEADPDILNLYSRTRCDQHNVSTIDGLPICSTPPLTHARIVHRKIARGCGLRGPGGLSVVSRPGAQCAGSDRSTFRCRARVARVLLRSQRGGDASGRLAVDRGESAGSSSSVRPAGKSGCSRTSPDFGARPVTPRRPNSYEAVSLS